MTERKKKILSIFISTSMLFGLTGCGTGIKRELDEKNIAKYVGEISYNKLDNIFIVEVEKLDGQKEIYLTNRSLQGLNGEGTYQYEILGSNIEITNDNNFDSVFGKIVNITPFEQYIPLYSSVKEKYTAKEVIDIFNNIKNQYNELINSKNIKKLRK